MKSNELADPIFAMELSNIPLVNLRCEFVEQLSLLSKPEYRVQFLRNPRPIEAPRLRWTGMPGALLTLMMQRAILGVEAYLPTAVRLTLVSRKRLTNEVLRATTRPFALGRRTTDNYYNKLPALASPDYALSACDLQLWHRVQRFYKEVRNPLFHGQEIQSRSVDCVHAAHEMLADVYAWIDGWHNPDEVFKGLSKLSKKRTLGDKADV